MSGDTHILIDLSSWYKSALAPKIELLHGAILTAAKVSFTYFSPKEESRRTVEPYDLIFQWAGWYLWGWCERREAFRLFKLMRMTDLSLGESFEKRAVSLPDLSPKQIFLPQFRVTAQIDPAFKWRLVEEFGPESFHAMPDGMLLFSGEFVDKQSVVGWIASFGGGAELLEPAELRQEVLCFADKISQKYRPFSET